MKKVTKIFALGFFLFALTIISYGSIVRAQDTNQNMGQDAVVPITDCPLLKVGVKNVDCVKALQAALNADGANLKVDGHFGLGTKRAVVDCQSRHNLPPVGQVGPKTRDVVSSILDDAGIPQTKVIADTTMPPTSPDKSAPVPPKTSDTGTVRENTSLNNGVIPPTKTTDPTTGNNPYGSDRVVVTPPVTPPPATTVVPSTKTTPDVTNGSDRTGGVTPPPKETGPFRVIIPTVDSTYNEWHVGDTIPITWENAPDYVNTIYVDADALSPPLAVVSGAQLPQNGTYNWTIPDGFDMNEGCLWCSVTVYAADPNSQLFNTISDYKNSHVASSFDFFMVHQKVNGTNPQVTLTSPVGGENWAVGSTHTISWSTVNPPPNMHAIVLLCQKTPETYNSYGTFFNGGEMCTYINDTPIAAKVNYPTTGSFNWTIQPSYIGAGSAMPYVGGTALANRIQVRLVGDATNSMSGGDGDSSPRFTIY